MAQAKTSQLVRLNKFIADCGFASRRKADELIRSGHVRVNGKTSRELGQKVDPVNDAVFVKGKPLMQKQNKVYVMFHKPLKVVSTMTDADGRPTVADYIRKTDVRLFPVGKLDWNTEGLLLLTNDGEYVQAITHPKGEILTTYMVKLDGQPSPEHLNRLKLGISTRGGRAKAIEVEKIRRGSDKYDWIRVVLNDTTAQQVRYMFEKLGFDIIKMRLVAIGGLKLGNLQKGQYEFLTRIQAARVFLKKKPAEKRQTSTKK